MQLQTKGQKDNERTRKQQKDKETMKGQGNSYKKKKECENSKRITKHEKHTFTA
jgi:hypothetical protein